MGLANVLVMNRLRWVLVAASVLKGADALLFSPLLSFAWLASAAAIAMHQRIGCLMLAVIAFGGAALELQRMSNHVVFIGWISLILALWPDEANRKLLLRIQVCVLYLFAGLSKINPRFLSGEVIADRQPWLPAPEFLAIAAIGAEWALCIAVWRRWRWSVPAAAVFHACLVLGWTTNFVGHGPGILVFNVVVVAVVAAVGGTDE